MSLRRALLTLAPRARAHAYATTTTTKATTGIVGLDVLDDPKEAIREAVCEDVLQRGRAGIPEDAGYRKIVEEVYERSVGQDAGGGERGGD